MIHEVWKSAPLALQVPLLAGGLAFLPGVVTTHIALVAWEREFQRDAARLGAVYLDGLAAALAQPLQRGDATQVRETLQQALRFQEGLRERRLEVAWPGAAEPIIAGALEAPAVAAPHRRGLADVAWSVAPGGRSAWAQRVLPLAGGTRAVIAAELDLAAAVERRARLHQWLIGLGLGLAALAGLAAALLARRVAAPLLAAARVIARAGGGDFRPAPAGLAPAGTEAARLLGSLDLMLARLGERERLERRLAERDRAAELGALAATVAHEVRNPLAGMLTAVDSARRFGADAAVRGEALDLLERGLRQIQRVVDDTLPAHRGPPAMRPLEAADIEDVLRLLAPEAAAQRVALHLEGALAAPFPTDAIPVRKALLNLLLNAVQASPRGGSVWLRLGSDPDGRLRLEIEDQGGGLPPAQRRQLAGAERSGPGLGLAVVMRELAQLDGEIGVATGPHGATRITLRLPPQAAPAS